MNSDLHVPQIISELVEKRNATIVFLQRSDLTCDKKFGELYLVLTRSEILIINNENISKKIELADVMELRSEELVGGGRLIAVTEQGIEHLLYYSNNLVPQFADTVFFVNEYLQNRCTSIPWIKNDSMCSKCLSPLPERGGNCPRCVPHLKILKRIIALASPHRTRVLFLIAVTALGVLFQVLPPFITKKIVDDVITKGNYGRLGFYISAMILSGLLYLILRFVNIQLSSFISAQIVKDLRSRLHAAIQYMKMTFFTRREPGEMVSRVMYDAGELQNFLVDGLPFLLVNTVTFFAVGIILFKIDWQLTLFVLIPVPLLIFGSGWYWKKLHPLFLREGSVIGHLHSVLNESLQGLKIIKSCSQERHRIGIFDNINDKLTTLKIKSQRYSGLFNELVFWIMSFGVSLVWYFSVKKITGKNPDLTLGDLLAFIGYIWLFYGPLQWFTVVLNWMTQAFAGAERIFEVIDSVPENNNCKETVVISGMRGEIEFRNVHFSYEQGKEVIKGVSFKIRPGEMVGLVGRSGSGKSTLINLITRFYDPDSGEILIDGIPLKKLSLEQLRKNIGIVMQEPFLFNGTIAENIAYGTESVEFGEIIKAAKAAYAHNFIIGKQDGYDTLVGDSGENLSGGEKQRIAIARAIIHNPPVLILDEATSSVDAITEKQIQHAIETLTVNRTTIAIAHRLSTLRNADRLIVLSDGMIAEVGSHDELLEKNGIYAELVNSYSAINDLQSVMWGG
ncbi:MAG: ABC transporter ATP-binding protein [Fibrobacter sp.]|nr:ABC transporter ATP-binding protein [Fibrobacter sp.]